MTKHRIKRNLLNICLFLISCTACERPHFITDPAERATVEKDFTERRQAFGYRLGAIDSIPDSPLQEALRFLYAYMPIGDITDYPVSFYEMNVAQAFRAKEEMPWGKDIPEREFRHFVLPVRVNNENLDESRKVFYGELKERIKGLSLYDAVLEVNHWCHEKVCYTPSDARTSSPLASVRTAYGRCGEESTLLVAALRSVSIPARQVYTPRWAHTDDNHAWVEAWVDGKWYFLGACEPEPVLNLGWFNAPASRGMLMHTKVFGHYNGPEEVMSRNDNYTEINVIGQYAPTSSVTVTVTDEDGRPIEGAFVEFKLYNYAEFHTVASKTTNRDGAASLTAGRGDMLVWASHNGKFGFKPCSFGKDSLLTIPVSENGQISLNAHSCDPHRLDASHREPSSADGRPSSATPAPRTAVGNGFRSVSITLDMTPPAEHARIPEVTPEQREENTRRMAYEDSLRNDYTKTFMTLETAGRLARQLGLKPGHVGRLMVAARGNHATLQAFLKQASKERKLETAVQLLSAVSAKDLRDVSIEVLNDHLHYTLSPADCIPIHFGASPEQAPKHGTEFLIEPTEKTLPPVNATDTQTGDTTKQPHRIAPDNELYTHYVLNPRVANEMLTPYKAFFREMIPDTLQYVYRNDPGIWITWCRKHIHLKDEWNLQAIPVSPAGVWQSRIADHHSLSIFFVSVMRSIGVPARMDEVTGKTQYYRNGDWQDVNFETKTRPDVRISRILKAHYQPVNYLTDPKYYTHFTLSKLDGGVMHLLNYNEAESGIEDGTTWSNLLKKGTQVDCGHYVMVTGTRLAKGSVLAHLTFFTVPEERPETETELVMRESRDEIQVIGNFNSESVYQTPEGERKSILQACGRGYYVIGILGAGEEPTNHALRDIAQKAEEIEKRGRKMVLLFPDKEQYQRFHPEEFPELPGNILYGIDENGAIEKQITEEMKLPPHPARPVFLIGDTFNRIVFLSQGYTIGLGEQLNKVLLQIEP